MALNLPAAITVTANVQGSQSLNALARQLQNLSSSSQLSGRSLDRLYTETRKLGSAAGNTINSLKSQAGALRALRDEAEFGSRKFKLLTKDIEAVEERLKRYQTTASQSGGLSKGGALLAGFAGGVAGYVTGMATSAAMGAVQSAATAGLDAETANVRLKALTDTYGEYNQAQQAAARIASTLHLSNTEATDSFAKLYAGLRPTGVSLKELEQIMVGFSAAARTSGATAEETSAAMIQLKQSLQSGRAQGDELRSILEQAPLLGQAIADAMTKTGEFGKVTRAQLKDLGADGKISTDILIDALRELGETQLPKLNKQFDTGQQAIVDFQNAAKDLGVEISKLFGPYVIEGLKLLTRVLKAAANELGYLSKVDEIGDKARQQAEKDTLKRFPRLLRTPQGQAGSVPLGKLSDEERRYYDSRIEDLTKQLNKAGTNTPTTDQLKAQKDADAERQAVRAAARNKAAEDEVKIRRQAEEKLADAVRQRDQQLADFRLETIKKAQSLERQLGDQRLQIEREIDASQRAAARARQDRALEQELQSRRAQGLSTSGIEEAKAVNDLFRQFEDQVTQARQTAADRQMALQRQLEEFKVSIAEGIGKIQEAYARSVSSILQDAGDKLAEKMINGAQQAASTLSAASAGGSGGNANDVYEQPGVGYFSRSTGAFLGRTPPGGAIRGGARTNRVRDPDAEKTGWDIVMPGGRGAPVAAPLDLTITGTGFQGRGAGASGHGYGNWITGEFSLGGKKYELLLGHFDRVDVAPGMRVPTGGTLGAQGITGHTFGTHVTTHVNPLGGASVSDAWNALDAITRIWEGGVQRLSGTTNQPSGQRVGMPAAPAQSAVDAARRQMEQAATANRAQIQAAQATARESAFAGIMSGLEGRFSGATAELDGQVRAARQKLEDERSYQLLLSQGVSPELAKQRVELERIATTEREKLESQKGEITKKIQSGQYNEKEVADLQAQVVTINERIAAQGRSIATTEQEIDATERLKKAREEAEGRDVGKGLQDGVKGYLESIGSLADGIKGVTGNALKGLEDQLLTFVTTGKASFKELAASILSDMSRILIQQMVMKPLLQGIGGLFGIKFADGGIMTGDGPVPLRKYAGGGIANSPQLAMFGEGSMPEAYVPLPDGRRIPVAMKGGGAGGGTNVVVNVDASGSQVQGDAGKGEQLGRVISQAVQQELIRQRRPGGLLTA